MRKRPGHCTLCGEPVFEIRSALGGAPGERVLLVDQPLDNAIRATFQLHGGSIMDLTFCTSCIESIPTRLNEIWDNVLESGAAEGVMTIAQANDFLLGLLYTRTWKEVLSSA